MSLFFMFNFGVLLYVLTLDETEVMDKDYKENDRRWRK